MITRQHNFSGIKWVRTEITSIIRQARDALEEYVEGSGERTLLEPSVASLKQVRGVLEMLQLHGAARVAEEMHILAQDLADGRSGNEQQAAEALMLALIQLPDYLEKLESGTDDIPLVLLPVINDLRMSRGAEALGEPDLLVLGLAPISQGQARNKADQGTRLKEVAIQLRPKFHKALLSWFRGQAPEQGLEELRTIFIKLISSAAGIPVLQRVFRAVHAVTEGLIDQSVTPDREVKGLIGRVDRILRGLAEQDERQVVAALPQDVIGELLHRIARSESANPAIQAVKTDYELARAFPSAEELATTRQRLFAPTLDTLAGIRSAVLKELIPLKDRIDLFIRGGRQDPAQLQALEAPLLALANILDMAGQGDLSTRLRTRGADLQSIGQGAVDADDGLLMGIAGDLLYVESSLENIYQEEPPSRNVGDVPGLALPRGEIHGLIRHTLTEAAVDMSKVKEAIATFIDNPSDPQPLQVTPGLLHGVAGALRVIGQVRSADLLDRIVAYLQASFVGRREPPSQDMLEALADGITGIDYFMEAVGEDRGDALGILNLVADAVRRLDRAGAESAAAAAVAWPIEAEPATPSGEALHTEPLVEVPVEEVVSAPAPVAFEEIDSEILEIFLEESREERDVIEEYYARWRGDQTDQEALTRFRRSFHTLKGSGRLVGAHTIGEFAWSIEALLNRLIDQTLSLSGPILDVLDEAVAALPELIEAQAEQRQPRIAVEALMGRARVLVEARNAGLADSEPVDGQSQPSSELGYGDEESSDWAEQCSVEDSELREIFEAEAREHVEQVRLFVSVSNQGDFPVILTDDLIRALHTLAGSARMAEVDPIAVVAKALERLAVQLNQSGRGGTRKYIELLKDGADLIGQMIGLLNMPLSVFPPTVELLAQVEAHGQAIRELVEAGGEEGTAPVLPDTVAPGLETAPEPEPEALQLTAGHTPGLEGIFADRELLDIFLEEAYELLVALRHGLTDWEAGRLGDLPLEFKRLFHTMKGGARMAEIQAIGDLSQALEHLLARQADRPGGPEARLLPLLRRATLVLEDQVAAVHDERLPPPATGLIEEIQSFETGLAPASAATDSEATSEEEATVPLGIEALLAQDEAEGSQIRFEPSDLGAPDMAEPVWIPQPSLLDEVSVEKPLSGEDLVFGELEVAEQILAGAEDQEPDAAAPLSKALDEESYAADWEEIAGDPELVAMFTDEANELVDQLGEGLRLWRAQPDGTALDSLLRVLHTLKGGARLAGVGPVGDLSHALESCLTDLSPDRLERDPELLSHAQDAADCLTEQVEALRWGRPVRRHGELVAVLQAHRQVPPDVTATKGQAPAGAPAPEPAKRASRKARRRGPVAAPTPEPVPTLETPDAGHEDLIGGDPELVGIFLEESEDLLEQLDAGLRAWQDQPDQVELADPLRRTLHTLKGGARLAGIQSIGDLSHALETLVTGVTPEELAEFPELFPLAQRAADQLAEQVAAVRDAQPVRRATGLIRELEGFRAASAEEPSLGTRGADQEALIETPMVVPAPALVLKPPAPEPLLMKPVAAQPKYEQVRVRSDLLDRLVNHAGEISIYRARLEEQNTALGFNLGELEQTVSRLHEQLRQMEIETEAQILYRFEREPSQGIRTDFDPLELDRFSTIQQLSRSLLETVNDLSSIRNLLDDQQKASETLLLQHSRLTNELQDGLLRTRMVPFSHLVPRLHRLVRQTAVSLGKKAELEVFGAEGEMDRNILERMVAPLEHILRNAISHGIEPLTRRQSLGKPAVGKVSLYFAREGNDVAITVSDDGAGLNLDAIRRRAVESGLIDATTQLSDDDLMQLILEPGFSTVKEVTQISGRGVGTDVVVSEVKQLGGTLEIASQPGRGTSFSIRLPFTLAISMALLVELGEEIFAVPHTTVEGVVRINAAELATFFAGKKSSFSYAGHDYRVRYLGGLLGTLAPHVGEGGRKWLPLLLVRTGEHRVAVQVDRIRGNQQIVMKSVGPQLSTVRWISGGTILADGRVVLILDIPALVRMEVVQAPQTVEQHEDKGAGEKSVKVMVVDDSITVRKVTTRLLKRHNMEVLTAKDGVDAVAQLQEQKPDLMLLDIEMPRMDGYELARHMRNSEDLKRIPIIMITSRTGEKHKNLALSLGVKRYLGKPYQETDLLDNIFAVLAEAD